MCTDNIFSALVLAPPLNRQAHMDHNIQEDQIPDGTSFRLLAVYKYISDHRRSGVWEPQAKFVNGTGKAKVVLFKFKSKIYVLKFNTCGQMAL